MGKQQTTPSSTTSAKIICHHCGLSCQDEELVVGDKHFCCNGCKTIHEILHELKQENTIVAEKATDSQREYEQEGKFAYLDEKNISKEILDIDLPQFARVRFHIPAIHCPACMKILEGLNRSNTGIINVRVHFVKKTATVDFNPRTITLGQVADRLASIGYTPIVTLEKTSKSDREKQTDHDTIRLAVAGFCFGNIMLLSFPEYLGMDTTEPRLRTLFSYLSIVLVLPVLVYSAKDYFITTYKGFSQKTIGIDTPIVVGLIALFLQSLYEILLQGNPGYLDSLAGLVFFLLIGKWFQGKTYENLAFDRDYRSYFPLAVYRNVNGVWKPVVVYNLTKGDSIRIRNGEVVPADSFLVDEYTHIDYSFVTGESTPQTVKKGDLIYAGGRLIGKPAVMKVNKKTSQSHLTGLWNNEMFSKSKNDSYKTFIDKIAKYFTGAVLTLALSTAVYWHFVDPSKIWFTATAVLIVACPCALALSAPFTYGSALRIFGRHGFYLKNADVVEKIARIDAIVFDKTGTLTQTSANVQQEGKMDQNDLMMVKTLASSSTHPLSVLVASHIIGEPLLALVSYREYPGKGIEGTIGTTVVRIGSASFIGAKPTRQPTRTAVYVSIDGTVRGCFIITPSLRKGVKKLVAGLGTKVVALLSGDGQAEVDRMRSIFQPGTTMRFNQSPWDKLRYISELQQKEKKVMMVGDGLNDSGALKKSDVGIAMTDANGVFTPACDALLNGHKLILLNRFMALSVSALSIMKISLLISLLYNVLGMLFAVTGNLTPLIAAALMPLSSISVVIFTTFAVRITAKKILP